MLFFCMLPLAGIAPSAPAQSKARPASAQHAPRDAAAEDLRLRVERQSAATRSGDPDAVIEASKLVASLAYRELARTSRVKGNWKQSSELYRKSLDIEDSSATRGEWIGSLIEAGQAAEALTQVDSLLASHPDDAMGWRWKGNLQFDQRDYTGAAASLRQSLLLKPDINVQYALAVSLLKLGRKDEARSVFAEVLAQQGDKAIWHVIFAGAYREAVLTDDAIPEFKKAIAMDDAIDHAHFFLGLTYLERGNWGWSQEAFDQFQSAVRIDPRDALSLFYLGAMESTTQDFVNSNRHLRAAAGLKPEMAEAWLYLGLNAFQQNDYPAARPLLQSAVDKTGKEEDRNNFQIRKAYVALGRIALHDGRREEGDRLIAHAKQLQGKAIAESGESIRGSMEGQGMGAGILPQLATVPQDAAEPVMSTKSLPAARPALPPASAALLEQRDKLFRQALASSLNDWGTAEARQQQYAQSLTHFRDAEKWDAHIPGLTRNLGIAAFRVGSFADAARALRPVVEANPGDQHSWVMLAMSCFSVDDFAGAVKAFARVEPAAMADPRVAYAYALSLARVNDLRRANQKADELMQRNLPADVTVLVCQIYSAVENYEHAASCFKGVAEQDPAIARAHFGAANALVHLDRPTDAIVELRKELALAPNDLDAEYLLAFALLATQHVDEASPLLEAVIAADPLHAQANYQFGKLLLERGDTARAIPYLEVAARNDPVHEHVHYQLQIAYRRAGRKQEADRELKIYSDIKSKHRELLPTKPH